MKTFIFIPALCYGLFLVGGCKKGDDNNGNPFAPDQQRVVSIALATTLTDNTSVVAFPESPNVSTFNILPLTLSGGITAAQDIHVTIETDSLMVIEYNQEHGTNYIVPSSADYRIVNKTITIPKGRTTAYGQFNIIPSNFFGNTFALGFRIISVDGGYSIATNGKNIGIAGFRTANVFEGSYANVSVRLRHTGSMVTDPVADSISTDNLNIVGNYITAASNALQGILGDAGANVTVNMIINADNSVDVIAISGVLSSQIGTNISSGSLYDPTNRKFTINAAYISANGNFTTVSESLTKQ